MVDERFQWRINPAVVAKYFTGDQLPKNIDVHRKPNEACAVIEDGNIVAVATATRMTLNPELGTLSKLLSRREAFRSFLFAFTGPHELLVQLHGTWKDGTEAKGIAGVKFTLNDELLGKMLGFPAQGKTSITLGDLSARVELEISNKFATTQLSFYEPNQAKSDQGVITLLDSALRQICSHALSDFGAAVDRVWMSWNPTETEKITAMRRDLEYLAEERKIFAEKEQLEMNRLLNQEINILEKQHQLQLAKAEYEAKSQAASELAELRVKAEKENEKWALVTKKDEAIAANTRRRTELQAEQNVLKAELQAHQEDVKDELKHQNIMKNLDRTMDLEDKKAELEARRRQRKMSVADEQAEFLREQERKASKHNSAMIRDVFNAMDDEDGA